MKFRIVTLNLEQDHKRWPARRPLFEAELARLKPDIVALNEVSVPLQTAQLLRKSMSTADVEYNLVQQTKVNSLSKLEAEAMLSRFPVIETETAGSGAVVVHFADARYVARGALEGPTVRLDADLHVTAD